MSRRGRGRPRSRLGFTDDPQHQTSQSKMAAAYYERVDNAWMALVSSVEGRMVLYDLGVVQSGLMSPSFRSGLGTEEMLVNEGRRAMGADIVAIWDRLSPDSRYLAMRERNQLLSQIRINLTPRTPMPEANEAEEEDSSEEME